MDPGLLPHRLDPHGKHWLVQWELCADHLSGSASARLYLLNFHEKMVVGRADAILKRYLDVAEYRAQQMQALAALRARRRYHAH